MFWFNTYRAQGCKSVRTFGASEERENGSPVINFLWPYQLAGIRVVNPFSYCFFSEG